MDDASRLDVYHFYEREWESYEELRSWFEWEVPDEFNKATYACDRWVGEDRVAVYADGEDRDARAYTFEDLADRANALANHLADSGVEQGDRVAVTASQLVETPIAHLAVWKLGAVSVPVSPLFGTEALRYRFADAGVEAAVLDGRILSTLSEVVEDVPPLETVVSLDPGTDHGVATTAYDDAIRGGSSRFETVETAASDPAIIVYTSGTTGKPKGVVHSHEYLLGVLPQYVTLLHNLEIDGNECFWTPVEWGWVGSFFAGVMPGLFYGAASVAYEAERFDPETSFRVVDEYDVTSTVVPPTAVRQMARTDVASDHDLSSVRAVVCGGEALGGSIVDWITTTFDAPVHDGYGQTEATSIIGGLEALGVVKRGKLGKPIVGTETTILDAETGEETVPPDEVGEIAVRYGEDPSLFDRYWNRPEETERKVQDGWLLTEDLGTVDEEGFYEFVSRKDDVIISSGYRIGPEEIEDALSAHETVVDAGVVGVPDEDRGEVPKAFVVLAEDVDPGESVTEELQDHVRRTLAVYKYPREIEYRDSLPTTSTGKLKRDALREE